MLELISIQVGLPQTYGDPASDAPYEKQWYTGFFKSTVSGPCKVGLMGLHGDGQADLRVHGGLDKAVLAYSAEHYPLWREALQRPEMQAGAFGENLTIAGLTEENICIGDDWEIGTTLLQVSQPRQPCWKLARRWHIPELPKLVVRTGWSGWYFRVLRTGKLEAGQECLLQNRPHPEWSISRASQALYRRDLSLSESMTLLEVPELSVAWRSDLEERLGAR